MNFFNLCAHDVAKKLAEQNSNRTLFPEDIEDIASFMTRAHKIEQDRIKFARQAERLWFQVNDRIHDGTPIAAKI